VVRKPRQQKTQATHQREEEAVLSGLLVELQALRANDSEMSLLTAVEYITSDPAHRLALYRRCSFEDRSISGVVEDDPGLLKIASSAARDLALLEPRKGRRVSGLAGGMKP
jgi:hypothetical protein